MFDIGSWMLEALILRTIREPYDDDGSCANFARDFHGAAVPLCALAHAAESEMPGTFHSRWIEPASVVADRDDKPFASEREHDLDVSRPAVPECIAVSLLKMGCDLSGEGCDLSGRALETASKNAILHSVADRLTLRQGDLFEAASGTYDMIVSNPPYIASEEIHELMEEVRDHEPRLALDGGPDGLAFYRRILEGAGNHLKEKGWLIVEIGYDQGTEVRSMFVDHLYESVQVIKDLAGHDRIVLGQRGV